LGVRVAKPCLLTQASHHLKGAGGEAPAAAKPQRTTKAIHPRAFCEHGSPIAFVEVAVTVGLAVGLAAGLGELVLAVGYTFGVLLGPGHAGP